MKRHFEHELGLDFETYSEADLKAVGSSRYARHPSTEALLLGFAFDDEDVEVVRLAEGEKIPKRVIRALTDPRVLKTAWNAPFEMQILEHVLGIESPVEQWEDTMVMSYSLSFPGSLGDAVAVAGLPSDKQKDKRGKALIRKFCGKRKPTKKEPWDRATHETNRAEWEEFVSYCGQDVEAERAFRNKFRKWNLPDHEWELWQLDQEINRYGLPVNMRAVQNAIRIADHVVADRLKKMSGITGLANPNSGKQLLPWLRENGYPFMDLKAGHIKTALKKVKAERRNDPDLENVLEMRQEVSKTSVKKYRALAAATDDDGRLRNSLQFAAAGRTWRWGGRIYQPQNLPRPAKALEKVQDQAVRHVERLDPEAIEMLYDKPMDLLSTCVRPVIQAPEGYIFLDADLNAIENRVLGWLAGDEKILDVFRENRDPYVDFAKYMFKQPYEELYAEYKAGDKSKRTTAKPGVLGCFAADTLVLTDSGWKKIVEVTCMDRVHDGIGFVSHDGIINQGRKRVIELSGVKVTPEHDVLVGEAWKQAKELAENESTFRSALDTARGLLSRNRSSKRSSHFSGAAVTAVQSPGFTERILCAASVASAILAQVRAAVARLVSASAPGFLTGWLTDSMHCGLGARIPLTRSIRITEPAASNAVSSPQSISSRIVSTYSELTDLRKLIASTMTDTMKKVICAWQTASCRWRTPEFVTGFVTGAGPIPPRDFTERWRPHTGAQALSRARSEKVNQPERSSQIKHIVEELTVYDVVNAGPNNRFVILTDAGPLIVHNCGYMLSAGRWEEDKRTGEMVGTGLLGYAQNMGIDLTVDQAKLAVDTFRSTYEDVVKFWYDVERAMKQCILRKQPTRISFLKFDISGDFCRMHLPSGRCLHYYKPRVEQRMAPWGKLKDSITYEGMSDRGKAGRGWGRITTHPGKITENAVQAIARDVLGHGMLIARHEHNLRIFLHVHDQIVAMCKEAHAERKIKILEDVMSIVPKWAPGLILAAEGTVSRVFKKDD